MTSQTRSSLKVIPLGGLEEVGRNMTLVEYDQEIIIIDCGLQFPEDDMPGIDYIVPDISYLKGREKEIKGVIITHGHYDHIGGIPHILHRLENPPLFATKLTGKIIEKRQEEYPHLPKLDIRIIDPLSELSLGKFQVSFFHVNHNFPQSVGVSLKTPEGTLVFTGDFKFDHSPIADQPADISRLAQIGKEGVLALFSDSTSADKPGYSISEREILNSLEEIFERARGRLICATFSSLLSRIQEIILAAEKFKRKVAIDGYSMKTNVEIALNLSYLKVKKGTLISSQRIDNFSSSKAVIICTGAQGEERASLVRIASGDHKHIKIIPSDTVIFSSSIVPGNERTVQHLKDSLARQGAEIIHWQMMDVHAGGHGQKEDLKMMIRLFNPKYFIPIHGNHYLLKEHAKIAQGLNISPKNIFVLSNGQVLEFKDEKAGISKKQVSTNYIMVDGLGVGDVGEVVLRDRQMMAKDGMMVIVVTVDSKTKRIRREPDIISRGFIYMRASEELIREIRRRIKNTIYGEATTNWVYVRNKIKEDLGQFLFRKTQRRPMIIPVVFEV